MSNSELVKGIGPEISDIVLVGDYPTQDEAVQKVAFTGSTGKLISQFFHEYGQHLDNYYRTLYIKTPMPGFGGKNKKVCSQILASALQIAPFSEILAGELQAIQPNVIIAVGELALNALAGVKGISNYRGSILTPRPTLELPKHTKIIPILHPRKMWEKWDTWVYSKLDIGRAIKYKNSKKAIEDNALVWIARTAEQFGNFWARWRGAEWGCFDIETYLGNFITCISFCFDPNEAVSVPLLDKTISTQDYQLIWRILYDIFSSKMRKVNQNINYDLVKLEDWGFQINNVWGDNMLAFHTCYPELPKNLGFQNSIYTEIPYYKDEGKDFNPRLHSFDQLLLYNAKDSLSAYRCFEKELSDLDDLGLKKFYFGFDLPINGKNYTVGVMPLFHTYRKIDSRGILVDNQQRLKLLTKYDRMLNLHTYLIQEMTGDKTFNPGSSQQVGKLVYEDLKCPKHIHTTPTGEKAYDTDEETLEGIWLNEVSEQYKKDILKEIVFIRKLKNVVKFLTHRSELRKLGYTRIHPDNRLRTSYNLAGTKSGRTSGDEHNDRFLYLNEKGILKNCEYGGSFQTIPKHGFEFGSEGETIGDELRSIFVPTHGFIFVEGDGSHAEARVVCIIAEDYETLAVMNKKEFKKNRFGLKDDLHTLTATWTTGKPFEEITERDRQERGKKPRHAGNYDMGAYRLSVMIHQPVQLCQEILNRFHQNAPRIRGIFHATIRSLIHSNACISTCHGRRRDFFGKANEELYKEAYSYYPQAAVSDHTKFSIIPLLEECPWAYCLEEAHDGLLFEIPKDSLDPFALLFKKVYEREIHFDKGSIIRDTPLVIPAEVAWSEKTWYEKDMVKYSFN